VRYVGEPVAVALARDRHIAEDALERIAVRYRPLPPVVDAEKAAEPDAPLLHPEVGSTIVSDRAFRYGDPEAVFSGLSVAQNNSAACNIPGRNTAPVGNRAMARNTRSRRAAPP
jgi:2-furoyl-CoA dehydrogenase large subunit